MTPATMTTNATARDRFIQLLRQDILQIDAADLDFGLYRVLNHRRAEIEAFLTQTLPDRITQALAGLPGTASEDEAARIFNALYTFLSRYYDEGDFLPRPRRGRGAAAYSVPYDGSDTHFHWATKGSHYVKSGERLAAYAYRQGDGQRLRLVVQAADVQRDNARGAQRFFVPAAQSPPAPAHPGEWRLAFEHRPLSDDETRRYGAVKARRGAAAADATNAADEDADDNKLGNDDDNAGSSATGASVQDRICSAWLAANPTPAGIDAGLLAKHITRYCKGRSSDFFVHPQLGKFLSDELDHYLRGEFLNLWDLPPEALGRERGKLAICRQIGQAIIAVLAALEDLQARLFEKRKFVMQAYYLVQCAWLAAQGQAGANLVAQAAAHPAQVACWRQWLGEPAGSSSSGPELLARYPHLPLDTALIDGADDTWFRDAVLACVPDIAAATGGVLVHGDNYAALRTLEAQWRQAVKCIYIDPPYNTDAGPIDYKNGYRSASWISLISGRLSSAIPMLSGDGVLCATIDDYQVHELAEVLKGQFSPDNHLGTTVIRINPSGRSTVRGFSICHEYAFFFGASDDSMLCRLPRTEQQLQRFSVENGAHVDWRNFRKDGGAVTYRATRPKQFYPLYISADNLTLRIPELKWEKETKEWNIVEPPTSSETVLLPIDDKGRERVWSLTHTSAAEELHNLKPRADKQGNISVMRRHTPNDGVMPRSWWDKNTYAAREHGSAAISDLFGDGSGFSFAKAPAAVADCIWIGGLDDESEATVLDYFAGSGTTAHAVINLNREDGGARRFILVEQGEYFDTVTLPRVAKVMACPDWKDGQPRDSVQHDAEASEEPEAHWSRRTLPLVQVLRIERYEDSLDALALPTQADALAAGQGELAGLDTVLRYIASTTAADNPVRLSTAALARPLDYRLPTVWEGRAVERPVDLLHTTCALLGLHLVRLRRLQHSAAPGAPLPCPAEHSTVLLAEVRPHRAGVAPHSLPLELLVLREHDVDGLSPTDLQAAMLAEHDWLAQAVQQHFGRPLASYALVRHNRDLLLHGEGEHGLSIDMPLAQAMWARDPSYSGANVLAAPTAAANAQAGG